MCKTNASKYCRFCFLLNFSASTLEIYGWCNWGFYIAAYMTHTNHKFSVGTINFLDKGEGGLENLKRSKIDSTVHFRLVV